jgi:choloylglycine hydrolase
MCTSISYSNGVHLFGRNLDLEIDYPINVVITPRNFPFEFRNAPTVESHYAMIGMGIVQNNYPLYFDAANEKGLGMAGLAFFGMAEYAPVTEGKTNIASFEFIQYIVGTCATVDEAKAKIADMNLSDVSFSPDLPTSQLHWIIADKNGSIVVERTAEHGLKVYDNPFGVLTNCPEFPYQKTNVSYYLNLSGSLVDIRFAPDPKGLQIYSRGSGSIGLPGGTDSVSRFVRATFTKMNSNISSELKTVSDYDRNVAEYFHILGNVQQVSGESEVKPGEYEITQYTDCIDTDRGIFYYNTYFNPTLNAVDMNKENLDAKDLVIYPAHKEFQTNWMN